MKIILLVQLLFYTFQLSGQIKCMENSVQLDTIMTFHPETYEERMIVTRRSNGKEEIIYCIQLNPPMIKMTDRVADEIRTDTITTFDSEAFEETVEVVNTSIWKDGNRKFIHTISSTINSNADHVVHDTIFSIDPITKEEITQVTTRQKND